MSSCVFLVCKKCYTDYCARGCNYTCKCGAQETRTEQEKKEQKEALERYEQYAANVNWY